MSDDKTNRGKNDPSSAGGKRPYATLDLKATELRVTPIADKAVAPESVPRPAPASAYATGDADVGDTRTVGAKPSASAASGSAQSATAKQADRKEVRKSGGFFSHLAAGIVGGVLTLVGAHALLPELNINNGNDRLAGDTAAIAARIDAIEKSANQGAASDASTKVITALENRLSELEAVAKAIPQLTESQKQLVAETKATLAAASSDDGSPQFVTRLAKVEDQMKALTDAGANDPNAGRVEQLAALTGKVADLETALGTKLNELRQSVAQDVESRVVAATEASEAARAGTQRVDRDVTSVKNSAIDLDNRIGALNTEVAKVASQAKLADERGAQLKSAIDDLAAKSVKQADIAAAVAPISAKIEAAETDIRGVMKAEDERRTNGQRVVLALQLQNLKRALERGGEFSAELADVKAHTSGKVDLTALEKVEGMGVPSIAKLNQDFRGTANAALDAEVEPQEGGVVDKLWAGARSIVRVRKVDHAPDDKSAEAIIGRMETALKQERLSDVLLEAKALPPKAMEAARPFLDRVAARVSVDEAVAKLDEQLKASLAEGRSEPQDRTP